LAHSPRELFRYERLADGATAHGLARDVICVGVRFPSVTRSLSGGEMKARTQAAVCVGGARK